MERFAHQRTWQGKVQYRAIGLVTASLLVTLTTPYAESCVIEWIPPSRELFRDAVLVYEGVASSTNFEFAIDRVWRGRRTETITLLWPPDHLHDCSGHEPVEVGERYLITVNCGEPESWGSSVFDCPSRAERIDSYPDRIRFLEYGGILVRSDLATKLRSWTDGELSTDELSDWLGRMDEMAAVNDWSKLNSGSGPLFSLAGGVVTELDFFLNAPTACRDWPEAVEEFQDTIVPVLLAALGEPGNPTIEDIDRIFDELAELKQDKCDPDGP